MESLPDIDETARDYYLVKVANGAVPETVCDGPLDGLRYFAIELDGQECWLTDAGLLAPLSQDEETTP